MRIEIVGFYWLLLCVVFYTLREEIIAKFSGIISYTIKSAQEEPVMNTNDQLHVHVLSDLGVLQTGASLQYGLCGEDGQPLGWGVWIKRTGTRPDSASAPGLLVCRAAAALLAQFLWENCVEPAALAGIAADLRESGVLHRLDLQACGGKGERQ